MGGEADQRSVEKFCPVTHPSIFVQRSRYKHIHDHCLISSSFFSNYFYREDLRSESAAPLGISALFSFILFTEGRVIIIIIIDLFVFTSFDSTEDLLFSI